MHTFHNNYIKANRVNNKSLLFLFQYERDFLIFMSICALNQIVANKDNFIFYCDSFILTSVFKNEHNEVAYRPQGWRTNTIKETEISSNMPWMRATGAQT